MDKDADYRSFLQEYVTKIPNHGGICLFCT